MKYEYYAVSSAGAVRTKNEDNFLVDGFFCKDSFKEYENYGRFSDKKMSLAAVFDGMGGEKHGEYASLTAAEKLNEYYESYRDKTQFDPVVAIKYLNKAVCGVSEKFSCKSGSTVVMALFNSGYVEFLNVGDSRAYLLSDDKLVQMSVDHNEAAFFKEIGVKIGKGKNLLTQHLGIDEDEFVIEPFVSEKIELKKYDAVLLCSDGLSGFADKEIIKKTLNNKSASLKEISCALVRNALEAGSNDNITVLIIRTR
jgi:protein phosphatase